ncbi:uncharacterized protein LOC114261174 [Camellia sinensis]|uniref:uncharacterized protein LOC114261174 n=1 Tax=Camellia sinensis TaxID=4442 RepID=UPI0010360D34|nr:uncharacterized protein LOC114261174 [Camellia sinensis]
MGINPGPPIMSREEFETRKADLWRKRATESVAAKVLSIKANCSMYFHEGETRFNRPERNYDGPIEAAQDGNLFVFRQKVRGLGAAINDVLNLADLKKVRWYVLNNCDEVRPYMLQYMDELEGQGLTNMQERLESEFHTWFLKYVTKLQVEGTMDASNQLMNLARGLDYRVTRYNGCIINGIRFRTQDCDMYRKTQNSGVVVKGDHKGKPIDFYGVIREIIELKYLGGNSVFLFKCNWWDVGNEKIGIKVDEFNYISVNVTKTWYKDEPFVLACQAEQVFYLKDTKWGNNYRVVQRVLPRAIYDILVKENEEEAEEEDKDKDEPYQQFESYGLGDVVQIDDQPIELCKEDMEMICVDITGEFHEEELEVDDEVLINDNNADDDDTNMDDQVDDDMIDDDSDPEDEIDEDYIYR